MFGPALNKHLKHIIPLIAKKRDLASSQAIAALRDTLVSNGGEAARDEIRKAGEL